jgi:hypothetical protein
VIGATRKLVGVAGFEPATPSSRTRCATSISPVRALLPAAHLGVPLLKEIRLGSNDSCTRHHYSSTILVILVITAHGAASTQWPAIQREALGRYRFRSRVASRSTMVARARLMLEAGVPAAHRGYVIRSRAPDRSSARGPVWPSHRTRSGSGRRRAWCAIPRLVQKRPPMPADVAAGRRDGLTHLRPGRAGLGPVAAQFDDRGRRPGEVGHPDVRRSDRGTSAI